MSFISETIIEKVVAKLDTSSTTYEDSMATFQEEQPVILAYFFSEDFGVLTEEEKPYLLYIALVIWQSIQQVSSPPVVTDTALTEMEEKNWELLNSSSARNFRDRLDVFFKDYPQEDLLAFVEDSLTIDEDDFLTKEGREPMVVALKSVIDLLTEA